MTKRTKKSVGTRRRKTRTNFRNSKKKTLRNKKFRNRKSRRGGDGSDDEAEETKERSSSSSDVDAITSGVGNLNVENITPEPQVDICPLCLAPLDDEPTFTTIFCNAIYLYLRN